MKHTKSDILASLDAFTLQYIETALWSSTDNADDSGEPGGHAVPASA